MERKSKSNFPHVKQKELSKLINDETIIFKTVDKGGAKVVHLKCHYQSMIMQYLPDENTYKKLDSSNKIQSNLLTFLRPHITCLFQNLSGNF